MLHNISLSSSAAAPGSAGPYSLQGNPPGKIADENLGCGAIDAGLKMAPWNGANSGSDFSDTARATGALRHSKN